MKEIERIHYGARGQGSLIKLDVSQNWISCYRVRGKEHRESTGTPDLKLAKRVHRQKLDEIGADRQGLKKFIPPMTQRVRVGELLDELEADYRLRQIKSWATCQSHLKPIRSHFGLWRASEITPDALDAYIEQRLEAEKSPGTVNRETQMLGQALRLGHQRGKLSAAPSIRQLPERNVRQGFFERPEFEAIVAALPDHLTDVARFGYRTGWRKTEILSLTWPDVDQDGGVIRLRPEASKNGRARLVPLDADLGALIERRWQARLVERNGTVHVTDLVFHRDGAPIGDFRKAWARACVAAGLYHIVKDDAGNESKVPEKLFHDLRRTAARNMIRAGVPERVAMEITGHKTRSMFDRYNIVSEADLRAAVQQTHRYVETLPRSR